MTDHPDPNRTVDESPSGGPPGPPYATTELLAGPELPARLELGEEIARGGMGAILRGRDAGLGREVAVKVLLEAHAGRSEVARRFVEEAQVAGQLQHPGVVPVYDLGVLPDRRPYFTMKLVKGQTLASLLAGRAEVARDRPRFLGVFLQACQAVAYAHSKGVIHRDLKPANVMVGAFGEVQVMDWGLAKVLADGAPGGPEEDVSVIQTARASESGVGSDPGSETQAGTVLGTPAYMAPEQARGQLGLLDQCADVFGLGAILCEILTGKPPFAGPRAERVRQAQRADLADAFARLDGCGADAELVGLCKRCLAAEPGGRPRDAGVLGAELAAYLEAVEVRLRRAEVGQAEAVVKTREERKRRRVQLGLAAAVLALVLGGGGGWVWVQRDRDARRAEDQRAERERERKVAEELGQARVLRERAKSAPAEERRGVAAAALAAAERADALLAEASGDPDLRRQVATLVAELREEGRDRRMLDRLASARAAQAEVEDNHFHSRRGEPLYAAAFREYGLDPLKLSPAEAAKAILARPIGRELIAALDDWAFIRRFSTHADDPSAWRPLFAATRATDPDPWRNRLRGALAERELNGTTFLELADTADLAAQPPQSILHLSGPLIGIQEPGKAIALLRKAQQQHPGDFPLNSTLGLFLRSFLSPSRLGEALHYDAIAVAVRPESPGTHYNLGVVLRDLGRFEEALAALDKAIQLKKDYAEAHDNRGAVLARLERYDEAAAAHRKAIGLKRSAGFVVNLGFVLGNQGKLGEAVEAYKEAIKLDPGRGTAHSNLAMCLLRQGKAEEALRAAREGLATLDRFVERSKQSPPSAENLTRPFRLPDDYAHVCHTLVLLLCREKRQYAEALPVFDKWLHWKPADAGGHFLRARVLEELGRTDDAVAALRQAIKHKPDHAEAHFQLGLALVRKGNLDAAAAAARQAIALNPADPAAWGLLAEIFEKSGQFAPATRAGQEALARLGRDDPRRGGAEESLRRTRRLAELESRVPVVLRGEARPASASEWLELINLTIQRQFSATAARLFRRAFADRPELCDPSQGRRLAAARLAVAVGRGEGKDTQLFDDEDRARWRKQAVDWLRADLTAFAGWAERGTPAQRALVPRALAVWQQDKGLAGLRDAEALKKLPPGEREACAKLWADVDALLKKVGGKE